MKICKFIIAFILTFVVCSPTQSVAGGGATKKIGKQIFELTTGSAPSAKPKAPNGGDVAPGSGPRKPRVPGNPPTGGGSPNSPTGPEISDVDLARADEIAASLPSDLFPRDHFKDFRDQDVPFVESDIKPKVLVPENYNPDKSPEVRTRQDVVYEIPVGVGQNVSDLVRDADNHVKPKYKDKKIKNVTLVNHDYHDPKYPQNIKVVATTRGSKGSKIVILRPENGGKIEINEGIIVLPEGAIVVSKSDYDTWLNNDPLTADFYKGDDGKIYRKGEIDGEDEIFGDPHWPVD